MANKKYFNYYIFPPEMHRFALFYTLFWISSRVTLSPETVAKMAKYGSSRPSVVACSSQLVVSLGGIDYRGF